MNQSLSQVCALKLKIFTQTNTSWLRSYSISEEKLGGWRLCVWDVWVWPTLYFGKITEKIFRCFRYLSMAWYRILERLLNKTQPLDVLDIWVWPHIKFSHSARGKSNIRKICGSDAKLQKFRFPQSHRVDMSGISEFLCLPYQGGGCLNARVGVFTIDIETSTFVAITNKMYSNI